MSLVFELEPGNGASFPETVLPSTSHFCWLAPYGDDRQNREEPSADIMIEGSYSHHGVRRAFLGVAEAGMRNTPGPVLVVGAQD